MKTRESEVSRNASSPTSSSVDGKSAMASSWQSRNAASPMRSKPSGKVTSSMRACCMKACGSISTVSDCTAYLVTSSSSKRTKCLPSLLLRYKPPSRSISRMPPGAMEKLASSPQKVIFVSSAMLSPNDSSVAGTRRVSIPVPVKASSPMEMSPSSRTTRVSLRQRKNARSPMTRRSRGDTKLSSPE